MVFKGGTSLSKTYDIIKRFSEDIDLAVHPGAFGFGGSADPTDPANRFSPETRRALRQALRDRVREYVLSDLAPALDAELPEGCTLLSKPQRGRATHLDIVYPTIYPANPIRPVVRIDVIATSLLDPNISRDASPYVSRVLADPWRIEDIPTLSIERTFCEKILVLHDARQRYLERLKLPRMRGRHLSRHYYDVAMISAHPVAELALRTPGTLLAVRAYAQANSWKDYSSAQPGSLSLVPPAPLRRFLGDNYQEMRSFIFGTPPEFDWILARLRCIESVVNRTHELRRSRNHGQEE